MQKTIIIIVTALISLVGVQAQEGYDKFQVQVDGLGCPFCAYGLEKKFKEFKGIKKVKIDIETGDFSFEYPAEKALTLEAVEKQVEKAGYTPMSGSVTRADGTMEQLNGIPETPLGEAALKSTSAFVAGNCGMCEARIVKAALEVSGVSKASWDKDTKQLQVSFDEQTTSLDTIEKAIAKAGHDTQNYRAEEATYNNLPGCCHYERIQ